MTTSNLAFVRSQDAWYADSIPKRTDEREVFMVGDYPEDGGCFWEFAIVQSSIEGSPLRVKLFSDAFQAFRQIPEFFMGLADLGGDADVESVAELMLTLGFKDITPTTR